MKEKATYIPKLILIAGLILLLFVEGFFGWRLHALSGQQEQVKQDYTDINNITLGLMSVDNWKDKVADIVSHQVKHFKLTPKQKKELQVEVEQIIYELIKKADSLINKPPKSLGGKIKQLAVKTFVHTDKVRAQVPEFARTIISKIDNPKQKTQLSTLAMSKFNEAQHTGSLDSARKANKALTEKMFRKYQVGSIDDLDHKLTTLLSTYRTETYHNCFGMLVCILVVLACWWFLRKRVELHATLFILSLLFAFILLAVGLRLHQKHFLS